MRTAHPMIETAVDFAIFGSDPLSHLLAGLLASVHRQRVALISSSRPAFGLPQAIDLSVGPFTRPETWALLRLAVPETTKLLVRIGAKGAINRIDPLLFAETADGKQGLAHIRHMAQGLGQPVERAVAGALGAGREAIQFRDAIWLDRSPLEPSTSRWLHRHKVHRLAASTDQINLNGGGVTIVTDATKLTATKAVLADDAAILSLLADLGPGLHKLNSVALLTEPAGPLLAPVMQQIDAGLFLTQGRSRAIAAIAGGQGDSGPARVGALLANHAHLRLAGQAGFQHLGTPDGAPFVGAVHADGPTVVAGLGTVGAFMAPVLARWLAGKASADEADYLPRRQPRDIAGSTVADYAQGIAS